LLRVAKKPVILSTQWVLTMKGMERRQTPRTTIEKHAYINIEPNNGGIVLNVSSGGLCFHSFDPVKRNGAVRIWFSDHNQRIDAEAELAWMDETQKGGLRFKALPPEAREQIRHWMSQPTMPVVDDKVVPSPAIYPAGIFPGPAASRPEASARNGFSPLAVVSPEASVAVPLRGFSGGLATGLLVAVVVAAPFLFHSYRRELGEALIRLGERFGANPQEQAQTVSPAPATLVPLTAVTPAPQVSSPKTASASQVVPPAPKAEPAPQVVPTALKAASPSPVASAATKATLTASAPPVPQPEKVVPQPLASPEKPQQAKVEPARPAAPPPVVTASVPDPAAKVLAVATAPTISSPPPTTSLPTTAGVPVSNLVADKPSTGPAPGPASRSGVQAEDSGTANSNAISEMYFEIGKFKDETQAHDTTDKLAQLGFPAAAVQKRNLWRSSYHVLVGPYEDESKAKVTHENLLSQGFKARPFERGSRSFSFRSGLTLNGAQTPVGDYTISWESYVSDANVKFLHNDSVVATADGRWVKREAKYAHDAYVYRRNMDGSRTLLEIHFGGMRQALVFGKSS
jgi:hypothetical protein